SRLGDHAVAPEAAPAAGTIGRSFAPALAPQPIERQAGALADDVPERDVDGRLGEGRDASAAEPVIGFPERLPYSLDLGRIAPEHLWCDHLLQAHVERLEPAGERLEIAHAG